MSPPRRIGVLGGTFDPVHVGHLIAAGEIHDALGLDSVVLVPAGRPWQKQDRAVTSADHRLRMTELAAAPDPRFMVSRVDVDRDGPTYSIDTVRDLRAQVGADPELLLLVGADALVGLPDWHQAGLLLEQVVVVGFTRAGRAPAVPDGLPADRFELLATTRVDVSSTLVRERVRAGRSVRYLVPEAVERYALDHGLYRDAA